MCNQREFPVNKFIFIFYLYLKRELSLSPQDLFTFDLNFHY